MGLSVIWVEVEVMKMPVVFVSGCSAVFLIGICKVYGRMYAFFLYNSHLLILNNGLFCGWC